jgi:selenide,water dikinase
VLTKAGARPGDALVLTKPLGVGIITTALKADQAKPEHFDAAVASMLKLNRTAAELLQAAGIRACTDVTGFALLGHAHEMAEKSGMRLRFHLGSIPFLPGAEGYADMWLFPAGTAHNRSAYQEHIRFGPDVPEETQELLHTPETSGGLLAAIPPDRLDEVKAGFAQVHAPLWVIGEVLEGRGIEVVAHNS